MPYKISDADAAKLQATVWLKTSAKKQDAPAPSFRQGSIVRTETDHTKLIALQSLGAYTLVVNPNTDETKVISSFELIEVDTAKENGKSVACMLGDRFNVEGK